jgi:hypothetical protein
MLGTPKVCMYGWYSSFGFHQYQPIRMKELNTEFLHMFDWFMAKYGKRMTKDHDANQKRMATNWHSSDSLKPLAARLLLAGPTQAWCAT